MAGLQLRLWLVGRPGAVLQRPNLFTVVYSGIGFHFRVTDSESERESRQLNYTFTFTMCEPPQFSLENMFRLNAETDTATRTLNFASSVTTCNAFDFRASICALPGRARRAACFSRPLRGMCLRDRDFPDR